MAAIGSQDRQLYSRWLLAFAALVLAVGALIHAAAFKEISSAVAASNLLPFVGKALKVLWPADSATSLVLAAVFAYVAARPSAAAKWVLVLLALIPAGTAVLIYIFVGGFFGGHILFTVAIAAFIAGLLYPKTHSPAQTGSPIGRM